MAIPVNAMPTTRALPALPPVLPPEFSPVACSDFPSNVNFTPGASSGPRMRWPIMSPCLSRTISPSMGGSGGGGAFLLGSLPSRSLSTLRARSSARLLFVSATFVATLSSAECGGGIRGLDGGGPSMRRAMVMISFPRAFILAQRPVAL